MANPKHLDIVRKGADAIREFRKANPDERFDLRGAKLSGANLLGADLILATLRGADLSGAKLSGADLSGADLSWADLSFADLTRTHLEKTNFQNATWCYTVFARVNLGEALNLETSKHAGPSTIGIDTIIESEGKIPESFLRDAGVPEQFIDYIPSLLGSMSPIQHYSCFISYSHKDEDFAKRLHSKMQSEHLRTWYAPEDIKGGEKIHEQIDMAIRLHDKLLVVLSEQSMSSEWVMTEIRKARKRELVENRRILFPIRLVDMEAIKAWECFDADSGKDLAIEVREYHIRDFSNWKDHDRFHESFQRLLEDLSLEPDGESDSKKG